MASANDFRSWLEPFRLLVVEKLDATSLLPILVSKEVISAEEENTIRSNGANGIKAEMIFDILLQGEPALFDRFICALREDGQQQHEELAQILTQGQGSYRYTLVIPTFSSQKQRFIDAKLLQVRNYVSDYVDKHSLTIKCFLI